MKRILHLKKPKTINSITINDENVTDKKVIANAFNTFFTSIGKTLADKFKDNCQWKSNSKCASMFIFKPINTEFVSKEISKMSIAKATGIDGINSRLLKLSNEYVAQSLTYIFNLSIETGSIPQEWKEGKVTPIFKEGSCHETNNYRPITVLSIVSKILERAVHDQLYQHLHTHNLLNKWQSGFRPHYSTTSALTYVNEEILKHIDNGKLIGIVFLDLKKAFDTVDHELLIQKLPHYGITNNTLLWINNYLNNRTQITKINDINSDSMPIKCGVPQGSILGPLLFTIFINDLPDTIKHCNVTLYADDTALIVAGKTSDEIQNYLKKDLVNTKKWLDDSKLSLNVNKTKSMLIGTNQRLAKTTPLALKIDNKPIEQVHAFKYLGLWIDSNYKFKTHLDKIKHKIAFKVISLMRIKSYISKKYRQLIFNALISPHFDYVSTIWSSSSSSLLKPLSRLYSKAGKTILNLPMRTPTKEVLHTLNWPPLHKRWDLHKCLITHKILNKKMPDYLKNTFTYVFNTHNRTTRSSQSKLLALPPIKTNYGKNRLGYSGASIYNELPPAIREITSIPSFKSRLKTIYKPSSF